MSRAGEAIVGVRRFIATTPTRLLSKAKLRIVIVWRGGVAVENTATGEREYVFAFSEPSSGAAPLRVGKVEGYPDRFALCGTDVSGAATSSEAVELVLCSPSRDAIVATVVALSGCVGKDRASAARALAAAAPTAARPPKRKAPGNRIARHGLWRVMDAAAVATASPDAPRDWMARLSAL